MIDDRQAALLLRRYRDAMQRLRDGASTQVLEAWMALAAYDRGDIAAFAAAVEAVVVAAQQAAVDLSTGFYSTLADISTPAVTTADLSLPTFDAAQPFHAMWHALTEGRPWLEAVNVGADTAEADTATVVQSTARRTGDPALDGGRVVGWRRVLVGPTCEWCQLKSTQRYRSAESADFGHKNCDCAVVPIIGNRDPGWIINKPLLEQLKDSGAAQKATDVRQAQRNRARAERAAQRAKQSTAAGNTDVAARWQARADLANGQTIEMPAA